MLFANVCAGFIRSCCGVCGERRFLGFLGVPFFLFVWEVPALSVYPFMCTVPGPRRCAYRWTPPRAKVGASSSWPTGHWVTTQSACRKNGSGGASDRRTAIDIQIIRASMDAQGATVRWVDHSGMYAGAMTQRNGNVPLPQILMRTGRICVTEEAVTLEKHKLKSSSRSSSSKTRADPVTQAVTDARPKLIVTC